MNIRLGVFSRFIFPYHGYCRSCYTTWNLVKHHPTQYNKYRTCFPLCQKCWEEHTPESRIRYYKELFHLWGNRDESVWNDIETAVLKGL